MKKIFASVSSIIEYVTITLNDILLFDEDFFKERGYLSLDKLTLLVYGRL